MFSLQVFKKSTISTLCHIGTNVKYNLGSSGASLPVYGAINHMSWVCLFSVSLSDFCLFRVVYGTLSIVYGMIFKENNGCNC